MSFINTGVRVNGFRPKTKKALKEAFKDNPESVAFDLTDMFRDGTVLKASNLSTDLAEGDKLTVVGPDPYSDRRWYATVERASKGFRVS